MLNRTAEILFWLGRYTERIQNHARLIDVNYHMRHELRGGDKEGCAWERLLINTGDYNKFYSSHQQATERDVLNFMTFDTTQINSIFSCLKQARTNSHMVREKIPSESWDIINSFYLWLKDKTIQDVFSRSPYLFYQRLKEWISLFHGSLESTMLRQEEWRFIQIGIFLERAENTVRLLQVIYHNFVEDGCLLEDHNNYHRMVASLKSLNAYEVFRKICADEMTIQKIIEFLMSNPLFPRSFYFSLTMLESHLKVLQKSSATSIISQRACSLVEQRKAKLSYLEWSSLSSEQLHDVLQEMLLSSNEIGSVISKAFFQEEVARV